MALSRRLPEWIRVLPPEGDSRTARQTNTAHEGAVRKPPADPLTAAARPCLRRSQLAGVRQQFADAAVAANPVALEAYQSYLVLADQTLIR